MFGKWGKAKAQQTSPASSSSSAAAGGMASAAQGGAQRSSAHDGHAGSAIVARQVASLERKSGAERQGDGRYRVGLAHSPYALFVALPPSFPRAPPVVSVEPPPPRTTQGTWGVIDAAGVLAHARLHRWTAVTDLGSLVAAVVRELDAAEPPVGSADVPHGSAAAAGPPRHSSPASAAASSAAATGQPAASVATHVPSKPDTFPELERMPTEELQQLVRDPDMLGAFVGSLDPIVDLGAGGDELVARNRRVGEENLERKERLAALTNSVAALRDQVSTSSASFQAKSQRQQKIMQQYAPPQVSARLSTAVDEAEEASDAVGDALLKQGSAVPGGVSDWVEQYLASRTVYHARKARLECFVRNA